MPEGLTNSPQWRSTVLGELFSLEYGAALKEEARVSGSTPVFGSNGHVGWHNRPLVQGPGIIVGRKGSVGKLAWSGNDFWPIDTAYFVSLRKPVEWRWLFWLLHELNLERLDASTGVPGLNRNDVCALRVSEPPQIEQSSIAEILDTLDTAIREAEALVAKLKQVKAGLLHDLLTRGLDERGHLRDPARNPDQFRDSPLGRIPKAWKAKQLTEIASLDRGKFDHRPRNEPRFYGGQFPFAQTGDIAGAQGEYLFTPSQTLNAKGAEISKEFPAGTVAITIAANIGDTAILARAMYLTDSVVGAIARKPNDFRFLALALIRLKPRLCAIAPQSAQANINLEILRPQLIALPEPGEQTRIADSFFATSDRLNAEESQLSKLHSLKRGLAHDLLTGRVRVQK